MKKSITIALVLTLCLTLICACGNTQETEMTEETAAQTEETAAPDVVGGWTIAEDSDANIPEEAQKAFDQAMEGYTGVGYTPIAYLGSQVVAGTNYAFLCKATVVTENPETKLAVVKVYKDLEGNASVLDAVDVEIGEYAVDSDIEFVPENLAGGWQLNTEFAGMIPADVQTAFDDAMEDFIGVGYTPIAYMGSQVVAGINHAILCSATSVTAEPSNALAVVIIYTDVQGNSTVSSISGFNF